MYTKTTPSLLKKPINSSAGLCAINVFKVKPPPSHTLTPAAVL